MRIFSASAAHRYTPLGAMPITNVVQATASGTGRTLSDVVAWWEAQRSAALRSATLTSRSLPGWGTNYIITV